MKKLTTLRSIYGLFFTLTCFSNLSYSQTNNDLVRVHPFSSAAALNGLSNPLEGSFAFRSDTDKMYYYDGNSWIQFGTGLSNSWNLSGNSGTNPFDNFIGTSDNQDLSIRTNNTQRLIVKTGSATKPRVLFPKVIFNLSTGQNNSAVLGIDGTQGRLRITSGNEDTFNNSLGASIDLHANSASNGYQGRLDLVAGSGASSNEQGINFYTGNQLRATFLGNGNFGINTTNPSSRFHLNGGGFRYVDGNQANGRVLTSDANGNASWQNAPSGGGGNNWNLSGNSGTNPSSNFVGTTDHQQLVFRTNNAVRMYLDSYNPFLLFSANPTAYIGLASALGGRLRLSASNSVFDPLTAFNAGAIDIFGQTPDPFSDPNSSDIHLIAGAPGSLNENGSIEFLTSSLNRMRISENGQVGVNTNFTNVPGLNFVVNGSAGKPGGGSWSTTSDRRFKKNITPYNKGLEEILKINTVNYQYNEKSYSYDLNKKYVGVIAQEIEEILPSTVATVNDSLNSGISDKRIFDSSELIFTLINAVKELNDKNIELENKLNQLEKFSLPK